MLLRTFRVFYAEQAGNPDGSGTTSQHIGKSSHDTGTPHRFCCVQRTFRNPCQKILSLVVLLAVSPDKFMRHKCSILSGGQVTRFQLKESFLVERKVKWIPAHLPAQRHEILQTLVKGAHSLS